MTATDVIGTLAEAGVALYLDGGTLRCRAKRGAYTPELRALVAGHRDAIVTVLVAAPVAIATTESRRPLAVGHDLPNGLFGLPDGVELWRLALAAEANTPAGQAAAAKFWAMLARQPEPEPASFTSHRPAAALADDPGPEPSGQAPTVTQPQPAPAAPPIPDPATHFKEHGATYPAELRDLLRAIAAVWKSAAWTEKVRGETETRHPASQAREYARLVYLFETERPADVAAWLVRETAWYASVATPTVAPVCWACKGRHWWRRYAGNPWICATCSPPATAVIVLERLM